MRGRSGAMCQTSLNSAVSAIEVYNKPTFRHREQIFSVLMVMAWEALLKAKILFDNGNRFTSLCVRDGRRYKRNRSGHRLTIGLREAMERCAVTPVVAENIDRLVDIRDAAVHLTVRSRQLPLLTFALGSASLKNYAQLVRTWFGCGLADYDFYILPLGFSYPFGTISPADLRKEPEEVALIVKAVAASQAAGRAEDGAFSLVCELRTTLVAAKKVTADTDLVAKIDQTSNAALVVTREVNLLDRYPHSYTDVYRKLRKIDPSLKQPALNQFIAQHQVKENRKYASYNFRTKQDEARGPRPSTPVVYSDEFVRFAQATLCQGVLPLPTPAARA